MSAAPALRTPPIFFMPLQPRDIILTLQGCRDMPRSSRTAPVDGLERMSSQPILTEDQRATLDAALAKRQAESGGKGVDGRV